MTTVKTTIRAAMAVTVLGGALATQSGCLLAAGAAAGAVGYAYTDAELTATMDYSVPQVTAAAKGALEDMKFVAVTSQGTSVEGRADGRMSDNTEVVVKVKSLTEKASKLNIRVGTFGDESVSKQILAKIEGRLKGVAAAGVP